MDLTSEDIINISSFKRHISSFYHEQTTDTSYIMPTSIISHAMLCGRDHECHLLLQAYQRSKQHESSISAVESFIAIPAQELVFIKGRSGTGKTTLAHSLLHEVIQKDSGFFLSGKFELSDVRDPYDVFVSAFGELPDLMQRPSNNDKHERNDKIRQAVREAVGEDGKLLTDVIPALKELIGPLDETSHAQGIEALRRFHFVFSKFVRAISCISPLVLFLDDLQWCDVANLSLLQAILESQAQPEHQSSLLVICSYRDEDLTEKEEQKQKLSMMVAWAFSNHFKFFLEHAASSALINMTEIRLSSLDEEATRQLVAKYLNVSPEVSTKLGTFVFAQCGGNPFHALQLLRPLMCQRQQRNNGKKQLKFDDIFEIPEATQTVDEYLCQKLSLLPSLAQQVLQIAACIGDCIDHPAVCTVLEGNVSGVEHSLQTLLNEGFLLFEARLGQYRFSHDRVRQAALSLIEDMNTMSFQIGRQLWIKSSPLFLNTKMFVVVNLLNYGTKLMNDRAERYKAAAINLEAGMKAISRAAFQDAARYLRSGIEFLEGGGDYWNDEYVLSLSLFNAAADAELCNQNFDRASSLVEEVFRRGRAMKDKLPAYVIQINCLGQRGKMEAATQVGVDVMKQLGEPLPRRVTNTTILIEIVKTRVALRGRSNETLLALPCMQDENKIACMYVLTNLIPYTFQASSNFVVVIGARLVRLCLQHGMHRWSANGFSAFGFVLCALDRKDGYRLGKLALTIVERYGGRELLPRVHMNFYALINHWIHPLVDCLKPLENACKVGLEVGDVEYAMLAMCTCACYSLYNGIPLDEVDVRLNEALRRMRLLREDGLVVLAGVHQHYLHLLTGQVPLTTLNETWPSMVASREVDSQLIPYSYYLLVAELAYLFGDLDLAARMLEMNRSLCFEPLASYLYVKMRFVEALICTSLVRNGLPRKRQNLSIAKDNAKKLMAWAKDCPQNYQHKQRLVEAELMSLRLSRTCSSKQMCHIQEFYDVAIEGALREGFLHEAALASELAGDFSSRQGDSTLARRYWDEASAVYLQWGATEKAKHLTARTSGRN
jgi:predicted ATPase